MYKFKHAFPRDPSTSVQVEYYAHLQNKGDTQFVLQPDFCGTTGESRRLEGFLVRAAVGEINLSYMAHLQDVGDTAWVFLDEFIGTQNQSRRLEGFAVQVTPDYADKYDVFYMAHLQDTGDTPWYSNGEFCGTRHQGRRVEGIAIYIADKLPGGSASMSAGTIADAHRARVAGITQGTLTIEVTGPNIRA